MPNQTPPPEGGGLVQKLLFPGFTHSGANATFQTAATTASATATSFDLSVPAEPTMSEADTEIYDNRTRSAALMVAQQQQQQQQQQQRKQPPLAYQPQILPRWKQTPPPQEQGAVISTTPARKQVPPLFATTQPPKPLPSSPPKLARKPFAVTDRSLSNVALADGERNVSGEGDRLPLFRDVSQQELEVPATSSKQQTNDKEEASTQLQQFTQEPPNHTNQSEKETEETLVADSEHKESEMQSPVVWEEEATPAQTAMAKDIIFRHRAMDRNSSKSGSDVSSTASEMGTVIGATQLQDLDHDLAESKTPTEELYSQAIWDKDGDGNNENDDDKLELPVLVKDEDAKRKNVSQSKNNESGLSTEASQRLSRAIRRIGSGLKGSLPTRSAPSTPRAQGPQPLEPESPRSPTWKQSSSRTTPTSFLLRSPGSSAFVAATNSKNGSNSNQHTSTSRPYPKALLSPRFVQVPPAIDEHETSPGPALPELKSHQTSSPPSSNPLQMARACFSFDAYYHDHAIDDGRYDLPPSKRGSKLSSKSPRRHHHVKASRPTTQVLRESISWDARWDATTTSSDTTKREGGGSSSTRVPINFAAVFREGVSKSSSFREKTSTTSSNKNDRVSSSNDVEREDALDLLACLVERGVTLEAVKDENESADKLKEALVEEDQQALLDRLIRSHEYALEMSRASQSAASWLKSIGRGADAEDDGKDSAKKKDSATVSKPDGTEKTNDPIDMVTARALVHSSQKELAAKTKQMESLNEELAKCRAEIGRLKTQQQQQQEMAPFQSPNRSILDSQNDEEEETDDEEDILTNRSDGYLDRSFPTSSQEQRSRLVGTDELAKYKQALGEANKRIRELHDRVQTESKEVRGPPPIVSLTAFASPPSPGNSADTTADEENFETEWTDLVPPLPPPPDHGLKSPIVQAVLEAWTPDSDLHESLMAWMETVVGGASPHDIPPLAISNLDTEVRDGLIMHVLPLLLRRADIRVDVQTRTLRRTTYDVAVSVETSSTPLMELPLRKRNWENLSARSEAGASVTNSSITALAGNHALRGAPASAFREHYVTVDTDEDQVYRQRGHPTPDHIFPYPLIREEALPANTGFSYDEMTENLTADGLSHHAGLMSTLGGALGGLMLRRPSPREAASPAAAVVGSHFPEADRYRMDHQYAEVSASHKDDADRTPTAANHAGQPVQHQNRFTAEGPETEEEHLQHHHEQLIEDNDQPYHRVVSAPPGRIGVTFVEYRGHAMVSKVATDSPLTGWMFPSDILIAIDELPVSGMRVRDIIQILRERVDRQRSLRIISRHSMDEFAALNSSSMGDG
eukprot:scaffold1162_cov170-Amphora_coffeaeformis.AAC.18